MSESLSNNNQIIYGINDFPPVHKAVVLSLQHVLTMFGATIAVPLLLGPAMGMTPDQIGNLISSVMLCAGIVTILQVVIGSGLPIIQGVSFSFLAAFFQIINEVTSQKDPTIREALASLKTNPQHLAMQYIAGAIICGALFEMVVGWGRLMGMVRKVLTPVVVGPVIMLIGLALYPHGVTMAAVHWPISIITIVAILFFSQFLARKNQFFRMFPILCAITLGYSFCVLFTATGTFQLGYSLIDTHTIIDQAETPEIEKGVPSLYNQIVPTQELPQGEYLLIQNVPQNYQSSLPKTLSVALEDGPAWLIATKNVDEWTKNWSEEDKNALKKTSPPGDRFKLVNTSFLSPKQQGLSLVHSVKHPSAIDYSALKLTPLRRELSSLFLPWGTPILPIANVPDKDTGELKGWGWNPFFKWGFIFAILAAYLASIIESFGDYHSCSLLAGGGLPTEKQINRGIGTEGLGCFITGLLGGFSSTSYSENIGLLGITKVGSKYVVLLSGVFLMILGFFSKFGAFAATIPTPIVGALYCTLFGLIAAIGVQQLSQADLKSDRNMMIIGFSLFMGLSFPHYIGKLGADSLLPLTTIQSWEINWITVFFSRIDEILKTVLGGGMAVAAVFGIMLDSLIPGTDDERGIQKHS